MKRFTWALLIVVATVFGVLNPASGGGVKSGNMNVNAVMVDKCGMSGEGLAMDVDCGQASSNALSLLTGASEGTAGLTELLSNATGTDQSSRPLSRATITSNPAAEQAARHAIPFEIKIDASTLTEAKQYDSFTEHYSLQVLKEDAVIRKQCGSGRYAKDRQTGPTKVTVQF